MSQNIQVLIAGESEDFWDKVQVLLKGYYPYDLHWIKELDNLMSPPSEDYKPLLSILEASKDPNATVEWVQVAKMTYPNSPMVVLYSKDTPVDFQMVRKNGADEFMHIPYDEEFISDMVLNLAPCDLEGDSIPLSALLAVNNQDFEPETDIEFDVYLHLPVNEKTLKIRKKGTVIDQGALNKASKSTNQRLYVKKTHLDDFYRYSKEILTIRGIGGKLSLTEKSQRIKSEIFKFMGSFLDSGKGSISQGKQIHESCNKIFEELELFAEKDSEQIYAQVVEHTGQPYTIYNSAINVAVYAANFSRILEEPPEDAAMAGLLHNVGLAKLEEKLVRTMGKKLEKAEFDQYRENCQFAANMVRDKRVPLNQSTVKAIENQFERANGSGYPKQLTHEELDPLSCILAISIRFQELTSLFEDEVNLGALQALQKMESDESELYNPIQLMKLRGFVAKQVQKKQSA